MLRVWRGDQRWLGACILVTAWLRCSRCRCWQQHTTCALLHMPHHMHLLGMHACCAAKCFTELRPLQGDLATRLLMWVIGGCADAY